MIERLRGNDFLRTVHYEGGVSALAEISYAGEGNDWDAYSRLQNVFGGSQWLNSLNLSDLLNGQCGENLTWKIDINEKDGIVFEDGNPDSSFVLTIQGNGDMYDYSCDETVWDNEKQEDVVNENINPNPWRDLGFRVTKIVFEGNITRIGDEAFRDFNNLESVVIPHSVTSIGNRAFAYCSRWSDVEEDKVVGGLSSVTIPSTVTSIGDCAFEDCRVLSKVNYSGTVKQLAELCYANDWNQNNLYDRLRECFRESVWMNSLDISDLLNGECGENLTWKIDINEKDGIVHEDGNTEDSFVLTIQGNGDMSDYSCDDMVWDYEQQQDVDNENINPTPWREYGFKITKIVFEGNITHIGNEAFRDFNNLESVVIPHSMTSIGNRAFAYCNRWSDVEEDKVVGGLSSVTIPSTVTSIGGRAFEDCRVLSKVNYSGTVKQLAQLCDLGELNQWLNFYRRLNNVFYDTPWMSTVDISDVAYGTSGKLNWKLSVKQKDYFKDDEGNAIDSYTLTISGNGAMANYTENNLPEWAQYSYEIVEIKFSGKPTSIGDYAFYGLGSVATVTIPSTVTSIGKRAFYDCVWYENWESEKPVSGLKTVTIPSSVKKVGSEAFAKCLLLSTVKYSSYGSKTVAVRNALKKLCTATATEKDALKATFKDTPWIAQTGLENTLTMPKSSYTLTVSTSTQKVALKVTAATGNPTYKSNHKSVKVDSKGNVTIAKNFIGTATITVSVAATKTVKAVSKNVTITVDKKTQPLTISVTSKTYKVADLKKKAQTITLKATKAQGAVSYKSSNTKYVTVDQKGKVTVKKGAKAGKYTVTVTAKGNTLYKSGTKTLTILVK